MRFSRKTLYALIGVIIFVTVVYAVVATVRGDTFFGITLSKGSLSDGLIGHWTFDGKNLVNYATDSSGQGKHGTLKSNTGDQTATTTGVGRIGQALSFDGTDDWINITDTPDPTVYTISAWVKPVDTTSRNIFIRASSGSLPTSAWSHQLRLSSGGFAEHYLYDGVARSVTGTTPLVAGEWYHIVGTAQNSGQMKLYVNGVEEGTPVSIGTMWTGGDRWYPGTNTGNSMDYFQGLMDDVRLYNRVLSEKEIERLYSLGNTTRISKTISVGSTGATADSGLVGHWTFDGKHMTPNVRDTSSEGNHGSLVLGATGNTSTTTTIGRIGQALTLDGVSDYVSVPDDASLDFGTGNLTVNAWFQAPNENQYRAIVTKRNPSSPFTQFGLFICTINSAGSCTASKKLTGVIYGGALANSLFVHTTNDVVNGEWHMATLVRTGTLSAKIYIDGVEVPTTVQSAAGTPNVNNTNPLMIGNDASNHFFSGPIDDVRVYNRALVADEIKRLYGLGQGTRITYTPPASNTAPTVSDSGRSPFHGADLGGSSSTKLFMNTWTDPEGDSIEYYFEFFQNAAFCSGGTGTLNSGWISDPTATGGFTVSLSAGSTYSWHVKARDEHGLESGYNTCYVFTNNIGGSCPYVFGWDGEQYQFEADIYGSGGLGYKKWGVSDFVQPSPNRTYVLKYVEPRNGAFEWRIVGDLSEINYFDLFRMYSYFVPEDRDIIVESPTLGSGMSATSTLHTISTAPMSALSATRLDTNEDVTSALSARDEDKVIVNKNKKETYEPVQIEVDFGDISRYSTKKLVVGGSTTYPTTEEGIARKQLYGREWGLYVQDAAGQWQKVPYEKYSPTKPLSFESVLAVDISDIFISNNTKLRLEYLYKVYVDYVALDVTEDLPLAVAEEHPITYADLHDFGGWHDFDKDGNVPDYYNVSPLEEDYEDFPGYYTRFGDVTPLLEKRDDKFVILAKRDEITVKNALPKNEPPPGYKRVYMLDVTGYYKALTKTMTPMTVEPMPFSGMSAFPYPDTEHYPDTPEYQEYRAKYNTRYLSPDTPRSGSSITDAAKRLLDGVLAGE